MMMGLVLAGAWASASPASAASSVDTASAALSFWMTWGLVYLAIGVVLMGVATAAALYEWRAWSLLLSWPADDERLAPPDDGIDAEDASTRAA
jgi:hypothetical protein